MMEHFGSHFGEGVRTAGRLMVLWILIVCGYLFVD